MSSSKSKAKAAVGRAKLIVDSGPFQLGNDRVYKGECSVDCDNTDPAHKHSIRGCNKRPEGKGGKPANVNAGSSLCLQAR